MFVVKKDMDKNILYVTIGDNNEFLYSSKCILENVNLFSNEKLKECTAKFRYRQNEEEVYLEWLDDNKVLVKYKNKIKSVTPGQVCAFYNGDECLGGGIIKEVIK